MALEYKPKNVVATYVDEYGDTKIIHAPQGKNAALRRYKGEGTTTLALNRAVAVLTGEKIKARRTKLGLSQRELCERAGFIDVSPKQRIHAIETASRGQGVRFGTLYALAFALGCDPCDLLPSIKDAQQLSGVSERTIVAVGLAA